MAPTSTFVASRSAHGPFLPYSGPTSITEVRVRWAADLLSGPGGLASFLRTEQLGARLAGPSLPLNIGYSKTIPPGSATP